MPLISPNPRRNHSGDRTGFWSGETLKLRLEDKKQIIIDPYRDTNIEFASYHLHVGDEIYVTPPSGADRRDRVKRVLDDRESFEIPPGQLALILTEEKISVPPDAMAFIAMRSKVKFRGLINVSGFHVDPGFSGRLIFSVFNAGPTSVQATKGEPWFVIFFADLDTAPSSQVRKKDDYVRIPNDLIAPISNEFLTFKGLDTKIDESERKLEERLKVLERDSATIRWGSALIIGFLLTFAARSCIEGGTSRQLPVLTEVQVAAPLSGSATIGP